MLTIIGVEDREAEPPGHGGTGDMAGSSLSTF